MCISKTYLMIVILSLTACPILSMTDNTTNSIMNVEELMDKANDTGVGVIYSTKGRSMPFIFDPLVNALSSMTTSGGLKLGFLYAGGVWIMETFFPELCKWFGLSKETRNGGVAEIDIKGFRKLITALPGNVMSYFEIPETECRYRAVCESSDYIVNKWPLVNEVIKRLSGTFFLNIANPYSRAWLNGIMKINCAKTYDCEQSPFKKIINNLIMKR